MTAAFAFAAFATGRRSCPSGHSAHSFHLATLLTLHLLRSLDHDARRRESACWNAAPFFPGLCAMFVACSPLESNLPETISSPRFAENIAKIELGPASKGGGKGGKKKKK